MKKLILLYLLIASDVQATEPRQQGQAAWALAVARQRLAKAAPATKSCPCSAQCVCGCNSGAACHCGETASTGCRIVNGIMVCPSR